jgi:hypothetical protein
VDILQLSRPYLYIDYTEDSGGTAVDGTGSAEAPGSSTDAAARRGVSDLPGHVDIYYTGIPVIEGLGTVGTGEEEITGTGDLNASVVSLQGLGNINLLRITGDGALTMSGPVVNGAGGILNIGVGDLLAPAGAVLSNGVRGVTGLGALTTAAVRIQGWDIIPPDQSGDGSGPLKLPLKASKKHVLKRPLGDYRYGRNQEFKH